MTLIPKYEASLMHLIGEKCLYSHYVVISNLELYTLHVSAQASILLLGNREKDICLEYKQEIGSYQLTLMGVYYYPSGYVKHVDEIEKDLVKYRAIPKVVRNVVERSVGLTALEIKQLEITRDQIDEVVAEAYVELFCEGKIGG